MSQNVTTIKADNNGNIHCNGFSGGILRGKCFQMAQDQKHRVDCSIIQLTKEQVKEQIAIMVEWLSE